VPFDAFFVNTRYGKTHVIVSGARRSPPLVLTHPAGCGSFVWSSIIAALSEAHRTYALDTIGELGRSRLDDHDRYPKTGRDYSAWLDDVSAELGIGSSDVVAGSMGGWIALNRAIIAPERVRRLVLLGPMGLPTWRATLGVLGPILSLVLHPTDAKLETMTRRCLGDGERVNRELAPWTQVALRCHARTGQPLHIPAAKLSLINSPTLLFLGEKDGLIGSATAAAKAGAEHPRLRNRDPPPSGPHHEHRRARVRRDPHGQVPRCTRTTTSRHSRVAIWSAPPRTGVRSGRSSSAADHRARDASVHDQSRERLRARTIRGRAPSAVGRRIRRHHVQPRLSRGER